MNFSVKSIVTILLLMLSFSVSGNTLNAEKWISQHQCICQQSNCSIEEDRDDTTFTAISSDNNNKSSRIISDIELNLRIVESHSSSSHRSRRIIEGDDLTNVMHKFFLLRERVLVSGQSKSYRSSKYLHHNLSGDYYVFALRHILI